MVLADLGRQLQSALQNLNKAPAIDANVLSDLLKTVCSALLQADVSAKLVSRLRSNIHSVVSLEALSQAPNKPRFIQKAVYDELCRLVDPGREPYKPKRTKPNIYMFVGLQGAGKTTTCTKLAHYYQRKGWKVALVCTDTFRAGAFDQLKQNATKANIPYYGSYTEADPVILAKEGVDKFKKEGFEIIIVDTSGRHKQEAELFEEMQQISEAVKPNNTVFVMDGSIGQAAEAQASAFKESVDIGSIVITKMDGHARGGGAISAVAATNSPILFIGTGEHMQDLEVFKAPSFVSKLLGMGDVTSLMETVEDLNTAGNMDMIKKIEKGEFALRDMYQQFQNLSQMGSLTKMVGGMMPGMPQEILQMAETEGPARIKKFMCILDSMNNNELDSDGRIFATQPNRIIRVAKGSGTSVREVEEMLVQSKQLGGMIKTMGGKDGILAGMKGAASGKPPTPQAAANMRSQMNKLLPPGMLESMGGMGGMQNMMKEMMGNGGMEGMQSMMQSMMGGGGGAGAGGMGGMQQMMQQMMGGMGGGGMGGLANLLGGGGGAPAGVPPMPAAPAGPAPRVAGNRGARGQNPANPAPPGAKVKRMVVRK